jgi:hypothetical protein
MNKKQWLVWWPLILLGIGAGIYIVGIGFIIGSIANHLSQPPAAATSTDPATTWILNRYPGMTNNAIIEQITQRLDSLDPTTTNALDSSSSVNTSDVK